MPRSGIMFWKRTLHEFVLKYTYMWKVLFQNTIYELGISLAIILCFGIALIALWKRALHMSAKVQPTDKTNEWTRINISHGIGNMIPQAKNKNSQCECHNRASRFGLLLLALTPVM